MARSLSFSGARKNRSIINTRNRSLLHKDPIHARIIKWPSQSLNALHPIPL